MVVEIPKARAIVPRYVVLAMSFVACEAASPAAPLEPLPGEELAGGDTTVFDDTRLAFALPLRNLDHEQRGHHFVGNSFFNQNWVQAPASAEGRDGLGPLFNARSCSACHFRDGRAAAPSAPDEEPLGLLFRLGIHDASSNGELPEPTYGGQLQPFAIGGVDPEGQVRVEYEEVWGEYGDGESFSLRRPIYRFEDLRYGAMHPDTLVSPRIAPAVIGLGLLEAIPEAELLRVTDPDDADGDGISGRPNYPVDVRDGRKRFGRFGWKANQPHVEQQNAAAFLGDLGITTPLFTEQECTTVQESCAQSTYGGAPEADAKVLDRVTFYSRTLAVPARRGVADPAVLQGRERFLEFGCGDCHVPSWTTGEADIRQLGNQVIWPYTDLLLHDMGEGLADGRPDHDANGREWRTPPLWGIGLFEVVNDHTNYLHDGRARDLTEATLWHGGEAEASREAFRTATAADRDDLVAFLESL